MQEGSKYSARTFDPNHHRGGCIFPLSISWSSKMLMEISERICVRYQYLGCEGLPRRHRLLFCHLSEVQHELREGSLLRTPNPSKRMLALSIPLSFNDILLLPIPEIDCVSPTTCTIALLFYDESSNDSRHDRPQELEPVKRVAYTLVIYNRIDTRKQSF